jgi:hypothetical protein
MNLIDLPAARYAIGNPQRDKMLILPLSPLVVPLSPLADLVPARRAGPSTASLTL